jgi:hypothetical protein
MSKRTQEAYLRKLLEENNKKSPEVHSVTVTVRTTMAAIKAAELYEKITKKELPPYFADWQKKLTLPADLYFLFNTENQKKRFLKQAYTELGLHWNCDILNN